MTDTNPQDPRLDELEDRIEQQRRNLSDQTGLDEGAGREQRFVDSGDVGDELTDDTIAPPG